MNIHAYRDVVTGEYPLFEGDVRLRCPDIGAVFVCPEGYEPVYATPLPELPSEVWLRRELPPERVNGVLTQRFELYMRAGLISPLKVSRFPVSSGPPPRPTAATGLMQVVYLGFSNAKDKYDIS